MLTHPDSIFTYLKRKHALKTLTGIGKVLQMSSSVNISEVLILKEMYSRIFILFER